MMPYTGQDFARSFRTVRKNTIQVANDIPADQWTFRAAPGTRSIGETLAHIAALTHAPRQMHFVERRTSYAPADFGPYYAAAGAYEQTLTSREAILKALEVNGEQFARDLEAERDEELAKVVQFGAPIQPSSKTRFEMLLGVKEHEMHHRGQLMLIERMLGIVPHLTRQMQQRMAQAGPATAR